jgi:peroxiredoxin
VVVFGISEDDEPDDIAGFVKETGVKFPVAWDAKKSVASGYQPETMPTLFIVDGNGLVRFVHLGFRDGDEADVEAKIKSLLR